MREFFDTIQQKFKKLFHASEVQSQSKNLTDDDIFNAKKLNREKELNRILEKINKKGINALTAKEKLFLEAMK